MPSIQAKIYTFFIKLFGFKKRMQNSEVDLKKPNLWEIKGEPLQPLRTNMQKRVSDITPYYIISPLLKQREGLIIWLHGGGYVAGPGQNHFFILAKLCNLTGLTGTIVKYPKVPAATHETTYSQMLKLYQSLLEEFKNGPIYIMGDSAGGGLGLGFALYLKELQLKLPDRLFLFSPWLDISMQNPELKTMDQKDILLGIEGLKTQGRLYAGENVDLSGYKLSPIHGDLAGLPPIFLTVSAQELFLPDCRKFKTLAEQAGVALTYIEHPGLFHDWVVFPLPEEDQIIQTVADQILAEEDW